MILSSMFKKLACLAGASLLAAACIVPRHTGLAPSLPATCRSAQGEAGSIKWLAPTDGDNRTRLDSWCAGVGTAIFRPLTGETSDDPQVDDVAFVSWNVHVGGGDVISFVRDLRAGRLTQGRRVRHVVLLLQEAIRVGDVPALSPGASGADWLGSEGLTTSEIREVGRILEMSVLYIPSMRNGRDAEDHPPADRGNAILSTLPLLNPTAIELPGVRQRRVAVMANLAIHGGSDQIPVSVSVAHLDATSAARRLWLGAAPEIRAIQARSLISAFPQGPLVLGADLNTWMGLKEAAARSFFQFFGVTPPANRAPTFKGNPLLPGLFLDYIFLRPPAGWNARYERVSQRYGSDHYPLVGWFHRP